MMAYNKFMFHLTFRCPKAKVAVLTVLNEIVFVKKTLENVERERDKMRNDLQVLTALLN